MTELERARTRMLEVHLAGRGITDPRLLAAFRGVPREEFVPSELAEFAYDDTPLPIGEGQTISQPYIVALSLEALGLQPGDRVLEVGTGSGYAAAILSRVVREVYTIERVPSLADSARRRLARLGFTNVVVANGDGTIGWPEKAPFDAIVVAAGGPKAPPALLAQLAVGGRLVVPVGADPSSQVLMRFTHETGEAGPLYREVPLTDVRFVPLIGREGWANGATPGSRAPQVSLAQRAPFATEGAERDVAAPVSVAPPSPRGDASLVSLVREAAEPIDDIERASIDALLERIGDARVVLLGECTHGTSEFYRMRARITRELIARRGFQFVAVEADWPDAARVDDYVRGTRRRSRLEFTPFSRFPTWMWRNREIHDLVDWLRERNAGRRDQRVGFHGLDLYSLFTSIAAVLAYLDDVDPGAARVARARYGLLTPWQRDPAAYGAAVLVGRYGSSEKAVVAMLSDTLARRLEYARKDGARFFDAAQNARLIADAEHYYRAMYYGAAEAWNLRDAHMFDTLQSLLAFHGPDSKGVIWEHNSHVGDATATEMASRGQRNIGEMCRALFGEQAYLVGFGTDHGTVAAASNWDEPMQRMRIVPSREGSYERVFHKTGVPAFALHLRAPRRTAVRDELASPLLERAIGVVYRPETELSSHYFYADLTRQFDEYVWFDETRAVRPLAEVVRAPAVELPDTYPFGL